MSWETGSLMCLVVDNHFRADKLFVSHRVCWGGELAAVGGRNGWLLQPFMIWGTFLRSSRYKS